MYGGDESLLQMTSEGRPRANSVHSTAAGLLCTLLCLLCTLLCLLCLLCTLLCLLCTLLCLCALCCAQQTHSWEKNAAHVRRHTAAVRM